MARLRRIIPAVAAWIQERIAVAQTIRPESAAKRDFPRETEEASTQDMQKVAAAIYIRETQGNVTTLRQLHTAAGLNQPEALLALGRLQKAGSVRIEHNLHDAFASEVTLTEPTRTWITRNKARQQA